MLPFAAPVAGFVPSVTPWTISIVSVELAFDTPLQVTVTGEPSGTEDGLATSVAAELELKVAVTVVFAFMVTVIGFVLPLAPPLHPANVLPPAGLAVSV